MNTIYIKKDYLSVPRAYYLRKLVFLIFLRMSNAIGYTHTQNANSLLKMRENSEKSISKVNKNPLCWATYQNKKQIFNYVNI